MYAHKLEKWLPLHGERAHLLKFLFLKTPISISTIFFCSPFFLCLLGQPELCVATIFSSLAFLSSSVSMANLSCVVATIFSSLAFLSSSVSMANLSCVVTIFFSLAYLCPSPWPTEPFGSCIILQSCSSSVSTANLSCLLATIFSSLSFLSNSFSSPHFNLLRVARWCFSWSSVSDDLFFSFGSPSCSIFFAFYPQPFFPLFFSL